MTNATMSVEAIVTRCRMDELHHELIINILSKLTANDLLRSRCVSKLWRDVIDSPAFALLHNAREEPMMQFVLYQCEGKFDKMFFRIVELNKQGYLPVGNRVLQSNLDNLRILGFCCGLVYFSGKCNGEDVVIVSNPVRKQYHKLPPVRPPCANYGLGFDSSTNTFKMVGIIPEIICRHRQKRYCAYTDGESDKMVYGRLSTSTLVTVVYDFGTRSWKKISHVPLHPITGRPVFAHGFLHWMSGPYEGYANSEGKIVSFDLKRERFGVIPLPKLNSICSFRASQLLDLNGRLSLIDYSFSDKIEIWVMKDHENELWAKEYSIKILAPYGEDNRHNAVIGLWKNDEILLTSDTKFFTYSSESGLRDLRYIFGSYETVFINKGSLFSIPNDKGTLVVF